MELYQEILAHALTTGNIQINFSGKEPDISRIILDKCYQTLQKIKTIIQDDSLEDKECFAKIEEIVCTFEEIGSDGGSRHDFA